MTPAPAKLIRDSILARRRFPGFLKLPDLDGAFGELGGDFEFSAQGSDEILERADIHVGAALELGDGGLVDAEDFRQMHLRHLAGLAEFVERHPSTVFGRKQPGTLPRRGRHFLAKRIEVVWRRNSPVIGPVRTLITSAVAPEVPSDAAQTNRWQSGQISRTNSDRPSYRRRG